MAATWTTYWNVARSRDGYNFYKVSASRSADGYYLTIRESNQTSGGSRLKSHWADLTYDPTPEGAIEKFIERHRTSIGGLHKQIEIAELALQWAEALKQTLAAQKQEMGK